MGNKASSDNFMQQVVWQKMVLGCFDPYRHYGVYLNTPEMVPGGEGPEYNPDLPTGLVYIGSDGLPAAVPHTFADDWAHVFHEALRRGPRTNGNICYSRRLRGRRWWFLRDDRRGRRQACQDEGLHREAHTEEQGHDLRAERVVARDFGTPPLRAIIRQFDRQADGRRFQRLKASEADCVWDTLMAVKSPLAPSRIHSTDIRKEHTRLMAGGAGRTRRAVGRVLGGSSPRPDEQPPARREPAQPPSPPGQLEA
jgi:hypothetical protein